MRDILGFMIRVCTPNDVENWVKFLDHIFEYTAPLTVREDFAPFFEPENIGNVRLYIKDGQILASAAMFAHIMITPAGSVKLGVIGLVATAAEARGQGYATQIIQEMEIMARLQGLDGILLWSDKADFYEKLGFAAVGQQRIYMLHNLPEPATKVNADVRGEWTVAQVRPLYDKHPSRVKRTDDWWRWIQKITSCLKLEAVSPEGEVLAYVGFGRGKDMQNIVHEWGGRPDVLHALLWTVRKINPDLMWLTHPALVDPIRPLLPADEAPLVEGNLALAKLFKSVDPAVLDAMWFWGLDSL